eukprot:TRINITY_DN3000_c0_g1_i1.p1 TRINITY_DN3000_c0_g1~~TRINITY_DN3000_c0_g1_i1.p1  ORF type:complete len:749 (-),score=229.38 TRINITY_DN3000_c0_g1_i1:30-2255(-)
MATGRVPPPTPGQTALYVGDLNPDITEAMIFEELKEAGPIVSIRVCRDSVTRRSLGYAYVNFQSSQDAERCLETLNFTTFKGRPCRIMWSQRNPALRKSNRANIFIKSLHPAIDHKALFDTFSAFGAVISCKVVLKPNGESAGYGFVHFDTEEAATLAVTKVNGMLLNGKQVFVGYFERRANRLELHKTKFTNIYVKNLRTEVDKGRLDLVFGKYGAIRSSVVATKDDGTSKGFGFVNYEEHEAALKAIDELHDTTDEQNDAISVAGKTLYVARHQRMSERQHLREQWAKERQQRLAKYVNLYIKNLDDTIDDAKLREYFEPFGTIISAKVMRDEGGASRGFGFVSFRDAEAANKATSEMNGKIGVSSKPLFVGPAQKKEERRLQLEMQFAQRTRTGLYQFPAMQPPMPAAASSQYFAPGFTVPTGVTPGGFAMGQAQASFLQQMGQRSGGPRWTADPQPGRGAPLPPQQQPQQGGPRGRMPGAQGQGQFGGYSTRPGGYPSGPPHHGATPYIPQQARYAGRPATAQQPPSAAASPAVEDVPLTAAALAAMAPDQQKNALGGAPLQRHPPRQPRPGGQDHGGCSWRWTPRRSSDCCSSPGCCARRSPRPSRCSRSTPTSCRRPRAQQGTEKPSFVVVACCPLPTPSVDMGPPGAVVVALFLFPSRPSLPSWIFSSMCFSKETKPPRTPLDRVGLFKCLRGRYWSEGRWFPMVFCPSLLRRPSPRQAGGEPPVRPPRPRPDN